MQGDLPSRPARSPSLEKVGLDTVWVAEAYGYDAPSLMGYLAAKTERVEIGAAILPIYTRTPTLIAMTAAGVDALSGGRCVLGLGASGPQVIEGFHGVPYDRPLTRTREIIEVCRKVWAREAPLTHDGAAYQIPLPEGQGTGLGKGAQDHRAPGPFPHPDLGGRAGREERGHDGRGGRWVAPMFFVPEKAKEVFGPSLDAGAAKRDPVAGTAADCRRRPAGHRRGVRSGCYP
jgi:F420-dependent oxidoreductase-like protein